MSAACLRDKVFQRLAEGWILVAVDDTGAPIDRLIFKKILQLRQGVTVLPLRVRGGDQNRDFQRFGGPRQTDNVAPVLGQRRDISHTRHEADLVIDKQHDAIGGRRFVVGNATLASGIIRRDIRRQHDVGDWADDICGAGHFQLLC